MKEQKQIEVSDIEAPFRVAGWMNFWLSLKDWTSTEGCFHREGCIWCGGILHPSKEAAVTSASRWLEKGSKYSEYLGAFEVDE